MRSSNRACLIVDPRVVGRRLAPALRYGYYGPLSAVSTRFADWLRIGMRTPYACGGAGRWFVRLPRFTRAHPAK